MLIDSDPHPRSSVEAWALQRLRAKDLAAPLRSVLQELVGILESDRVAQRELFLSVVIRTQLRRWEQLQDALLCLFAQTDQSFEILLMLHNVDLEVEPRVRNLIESYPTEFADRIRLIAVQGGGRSRPLARAIDQLRGEYVAFFDDDDLLMAHWVESFHKASLETPGQVIRANVALQINRVEEWGYGITGQRTMSLVMPEYSDRFSLIDHLERNHTPFMGFAFPVSFFVLWGERFDEELPVCEDWDIALRAAGLLGVNSSNQLTAIYRRWENTQTSYTHHGAEEWRDAAERVRGRMASTPYFMPVGASEEAIELLTREHRAQQERAIVLGSTFWRVTSPLRRIVDRLRVRKTGTESDIVTRNSEEMDS